MAYTKDGFVYAETTRGEEFAVAGKDIVCFKMVILRPDSDGVQHTLGVFRQEGKSVTRRFVDPYSKIADELAHNSHLERPRKVVEQGWFAGMIDRLISNP